MSNLTILTIEEGKKHFTLYFNNRDSLSVLKETYFMYSLYELEEVTSQLIEDIKKRDQLIICEITARKNLTGGLKTTNRLFFILSDKGYKEPIIEQVINKLTTEGLLNDIVYAEKYIIKKIKGKKISKNMLVNLLVQEGIDETITLELLEKHHINDYETAKLLFNKRYKGKVKEVEKIYKYLSSKGFEQDVIFAILGKEI